MLLIFSNPFSCPSPLKLAFFFYNGFLDVKNRKKCHHFHFGRHLGLPVARTRDWGLTISMPGSITISKWPFTIRNGLARRTMSFMLPLHTKTASWIREYRGIPRYTANTAVFAAPHVESNNCFAERQWSLKGQIHAMFCFFMSSLRA